MKKAVYVLLCNVDYEGTYFESVFSTKARAFKAKKSRKRCSGQEYEVHKVVLDLDEPGEEVAEGMKQK